MILNNTPVEDVHFFCHHFCSDKGKCRLRDSLLSRHLPIRECCTTVIRAPLGPARRSEPGTPAHSARPQAPWRRRSGACTGPRVRTLNRRGPFKRSVSFLVLEPSGVPLSAVSASISNLIKASIGLLAEIKNVVQYHTSISKYFSTRLNHQRIFCWNLK